MNRFVRETIFDGYDNEHIKIHDDRRLRKVEKRRNFKLSKQNFDVGFM